MIGEAKTYGYAPKPKDMECLYTLIGILAKGTNPTDTDIEILSGCTSLDSIKNLRGCPPRHDLLPGNRVA